ncbi:hypothetical protein [Trichormus sp. NMC-1]|uniref:hypothetical protein n=1 Tax=Trichormus sp. NMC-1 TaxID=1853259 RepID=UPI00116003C4|nr:hypothetical protein [Trichormus sp. NMC-1]
MSESGCPGFKDLQDGLVILALLKPGMNLGVETFRRNVSTRVWISSKIIFIHQISNAVIMIGLMSVI